MDEELRLQRLVGDGRAVIIAVDHGLFDGPIPAMEDLPKTVGRSTRKSMPSCYPRDAPALPRDLRPAETPLAVVRLNWNTVCTASGLGYREGQCLHRRRGLASSEGMDIASGSLTLETGSERRDAENVEIFSEVDERLHHQGLP